MGPGAGFGPILMRFLAFDIIHTTNDISTLGGGGGVKPASTSPPIISLTSPKPVFTIEQNCSSLFTTFWSRDSMTSLEKSEGLPGRVEISSNL